MYFIRFFSPRYLAPSVTSCFYGFWFEISAQKEGVRKSYEDSNCFDVVPGKQFQKAQLVWCVIPSSAMWEMGDVSEEEAEDGKLILASFLKRHIVEVCLNNEDVFFLYK